MLQIEAVHVRGGVNLLEVSMFQLRSWMNMFYPATSAEPTAEKSGGEFEGGGQSDSNSDSESDSESDSSSDQYDRPALLPPFPTRRPPLPWAAQVQFRAVLRSSRRPRTAASESRG